MTLRVAGCLAIALASAGAAPPSAAAHGIVGRADLPIPQWLFGWAAAIVLVASFVALATLWRDPRLQEPRLRRVARVPAAVDVACGAFGIALFALVVYTGLAGTQTAAANLTPTFVYVAFWVAVPVVSALAGDVFALLSPWRAAARGAAWLAARALSGPLRAPFQYPGRLGRWPAVATVLAFTWLELAYGGGRDDPSLLAGLALAYAVVQLAGMSLFGVDAWTTRADGFAVLFNFFSRLSPWERRDGVLHLRPPLSGAPRIDELPATAAVLCVAIGTTSFDGLAQGNVWGALVGPLRSAFAGVGLPERATLDAAFTVGLVGCAVLAAGLYRLGTWGMSGTGKDHPARELAAGFAHSLVPIAYAYLLAHYFSLLAYQGRALFFLASDPLGRDADLLGTAGQQIDYGVIQATGIWYVQVGALVCGHVAGLVLAHDRAVALYSDPHAATRSQYWMLVVMVAFTSAGLWLLASVGAS